MAALCGGDDGQRRPDAGPDERGGGRHLFYCSWNCWLGGTVVLVVVGVIQAPGWYNRQHHLGIGTHPWGLVCVCLCHWSNPSGTKRVVNGPDHQIPHFDRAGSEAGGFLLYPPWISRADRLCCCCPVDISCRSPLLLLPSQCWSDSPDFREKSSRKGQGLGRHVIAFLCR